jgi:hypothetical protein
MIGHPRSYSFSANLYPIAETANIESPPPVPNGTVKHVYDNLNDNCYITNQPYNGNDINPEVRVNSDIQVMRNDSYENSFHNIYIHDDIHDLHIKAKSEPLIRTYEKETNIEESLDYHINNNNSTGKISIKKPGNPGQTEYSTKYKDKSGYPNIPNMPPPRAKYLHKNSDKTVDDKYINRNKDVNEKYIDYSQNRISKDSYDDDSLHSYSSGGTLLKGSLRYIYIY